MNIRMCIAFKLFVYNTRRLIRWIAQYKTAIGVHNYWWSGKCPAFWFTMYRHSYHSHKSSSPIPSKTTFLVSAPAPSTCRVVEDDCWRVNALFELDALIGPLCEIRNATVKLYTCTVLLHSTNVYDARLVIACTLYHRILVHVSSIQLNKISNS